MGLGGSKIVPLPIPNVLRRLTECAIPDDKEHILDFIEMLDINLCNPKMAESAAQQFKEFDGVMIVCKLMKKMIEDKDLIAVCLQMFETIRFNVPVIMDFILYGGLDILEKAIRIHAKDDFISFTIPKLLKILLAVGAAASIEEINKEALNLQLCQKCQETIERLKKTEFQAKVAIPKSSDRMNRVLKYMDSYIARIDVQVAALDAVISFARNPDALFSTRETNLVDIVGNSIKAHPTAPEIIWRSCMALSIVAKFHAEIAYDISNLDIDEQLIDNYHEFDTHPLVQQQILWLLAAYLDAPKSRLLLHKSQKVIDFFKVLVDWDESVENPTKKDKAAKADPNKSLAPSEMSKLTKGKSQSNINNNNNNSTVDASAIIMDKSGKSGKLKKEKSKANIAKDEDKNKETVQQLQAPIKKKETFELVVPLSIRRFLRETRGKLYNEKKVKKQVAGNFKQRRNFDERPKFGTVETVLFVKGEDGLIATGPEDDEGNQERMIPDWEKKLNYGEKKETKKK